MKLTPQDILNQTFARRLKGFDPDEVRSFLSQIVETLEAEIKEKEEIRQKMERFRENYQKYEKREELLRDTLIAAQRFSSEIKLNAQKEGELLVREAEVKADDVINRAQNRHNLLTQEIKSLQFKRREIEADIINMLNSLKDLIETYHREDEEFDKIEYLAK